MKKLFLIAAIVVALLLPVSAEASIIIPSGQDVILSWNAATDAGSGVEGYNIYRNDVKLNTSLITATTYTDVNPPDGLYTYKAEAVDYAHNVGPQSDESEQVIKDSVAPDKVTGLTVGVIVGK